MKRLPLLVAVGCLLGGFAAMTLFSLLWKPPAGLPRMWDSWGGTIGDLLLPVVLYGLTSAWIRMGDPGEGLSRVSLAVGLAGAGLGAGSQAAWLADPTPRPNWVLVEAHRFSPVGWYHAAFLVITAGYVAASTFELLQRARRARRHASGATDQWALRRHRRLRSVLSGNGSALVMCAAALFVLAESGHVKVLVGGQLGPG